MKFKISTTVASYEEVMAIAQDCEGEEDEDNNGYNN